jgi:hypothetical protein
MIQRTANFITVREVITDMGLEPTNELVSQVEEMMADSFERLCGESPLKLLEPIFTSNITGYRSLFLCSWARWNGKRIPEKYLLSNR